MSDVVGNHRAIGDEAGTPGREAENPRPSGQGVVNLGLTAAGVGQLDPRLQLQLQGLGASRWQTIWWLWREARLFLLAALMAGFGSVISEVGAAMMVGGNISGQTRVLTTAIVLDVGRGEFGAAVKLAGILLTLAFLVNGVLTWAQVRGQRH